MSQYNDEVMQLSSYMRLHDLKTCCTSGRGKFGLPFFLPLALTYIG